MGGGGGPGRDIPEQVIKDTLNNGEDFTLAENETTYLTKILIIPEGRTLTNNGTIDLGEAGLEIQGSLINNGTITNQEARISITKNGNVVNGGNINLDGKISISTINTTVTFIKIQNIGQIKASRFEVVGNDPNISTTISLDASSNFIITESIINKAVGEFNIIGKTPGMSKTPLSSSLIETHSPTNFKNIQIQTEEMKATDTLTLENTLIVSTGIIRQEKSLIIENGSNIECQGDGLFGLDGEASQVNIDTDSQLIILGTTVIISNIINEGIVTIESGKVLLLKNNTFNNTGKIINYGKLRQFTDTNSSIEAKSFGKIITTGTVTGLNLKNQQITTDGDGIVIAGTKNEDGKIPFATHKTIEWDANYNPGTGDEDFKVKRSTADPTKFEIEFVEFYVTFFKDNIKVYLPNGDQPYTNANNPGFTINTWYKQHDGVGSEPIVFGIQA